MNSLYAIIAGGVGIVVFLVVCVLFAAAAMDYYVTGGHDDKS